MTITKEYWNLPKADEVLNISQGANLTVFVDHAEKVTYFGLEVTEWTALIGLALSLIGLIVAGFAGWAAFNANKLAKSEADANKNHAMLSVRPFLAMHIHHYDSKSKYKVELRNAGLGPAKVKKFEVYLDGKVVEGSKEKNELEIAFESLSLICPIDATDDHTIVNPKLSCTSLNEGAILSLDQTMVLLELDFCEVKYKYDWITPLLEKHLHIYISYTDVYGEYAGEWSTNK